MKGLQLKMSVLLLVFALSLSLVQSHEVYAYTDNSMERLFETNGIDKEFLIAFSAKQIAEIESVLKKGVNRVSVVQNVFRVDILDEIKAIYSSPYSLNNPKCQDVIKTIDKMVSMSAKEISSKFGISISQAKIFKDFLNRQKSLHDKTITTDNIARAAGSITSAEMSTLLLCTDLCGMEEAANGPLYRVYASFNWKKPFFIGCFQDVIAIAWGGGLNSRYEEAWADYYTYSQGINGSYKRRDHTSDSNSSEYEPNRGVSFYFDQNQELERYYDGEPYVSKLKLAATEVDLFQDYYEGKSTKVIVQYGHAVLDVFGGSGVTIGAGGVGVSISFAKGFDKSEQLQKNITY